MLEIPSFGSSFELQPATYNIARYIVPDSIKPYMAILGTLNSFPINLRISFIVQSFFNIFEKNSSPKKLNGPKNSTIFQVKTQRTGSNSSHMNFKTHFQHFCCK